MATTKEVGQYEVEAMQFPRLWKAQTAYRSAQFLQDQGHFGCAANRYYYATIHTAFAFVSEAEDAEPHWKHADLIAEYLRQHDRGAQEAFSRAQSARNRADYTPVTVNDRKLGMLIQPVTDMLVRAFERCKIRKKTTCLTG